MEIKLSRQQWEKERNTKDGEMLVEDWFYDAWVIKKLAEENNIPKPDFSIFKKELINNLEQQHKDYQSLFKGVI